MKKHIEFAHPSGAKGEESSPWTTTAKTRFKEQCIDSDYADRRFKFPLGETWCRIVPALKDSSYGWMLGLHTINTPNGRHVHTKTLLPGATTAFDHAYAWLKKNHPEKLFSKTNKDGVRLLTSPMCLFWVITEVGGEPVARLVLASGYDGSRGGLVGLGYRILQLSHDKNEKGESAFAPTDSLNAPQICITKTQPAGAKYPSYSLRVGRDSKPLNEIIARMSPTEREVIEPLESTVYLPELDEEWDLLAEIIDKDLVAQIKDSMS